MRVFKNVRFGRFTRKENISDETLLAVVKRIESGLVDADLGGGVIKQRIARDGQGKSGGFRTLILYRKAERAFFVYGFAKSNRGNVSNEEASALKELADNVLNLSDDFLEELLKQGVYTEVLENDAQNVQK
ncbi:MAG: type II toxin-antitoxin system RelE/ParE family toxin [Clostridiales bacterium]|nr:type II toxin-antitoxin system RelE/ParE family toxin [Clostridiales bacterium]